MSEIADLLADLADERGDYGRLHDYTHPTRLGLHHYLTRPQTERCPQHGPYTGVGPDSECPTCTDHAHTRYHPH